MLIKELTIEGFRGFRKFKMGDLGRVNLLVGENNCGKTSVLEAIHFLARKDWNTLWQTLSRRGEEFVDDDVRPHSSKVEVRRLFLDHKLEIGSMFKVVAHGANTDLTVAGEIVENPNFPPAFRLTWDGAHSLSQQLTANGGIPSEVIKNNKLFFGITKTSIPIEFVTGLGAETVVEKFNEIVLTPNEKLVYEALDIIEPTIDRIAPDGINGSTLRGGFWVHCSDSKDRIPIGSFGEGIWRMLGLALALVNAKNGILLVDDIDTGLHHGVIEDMWRLVSETSKRLNTQVFATTHSRDCYESLAVVCGERDAENSETTIQRIERNRPVAVSYSEQEILAAAERAIEVR